MKKRYFAAGFLALLLAADFIVAYPCSATLTRALKTSIEERLVARVSFRQLRLHPLFLSFSLRDLELRDPESPNIQVLRGSHLHGHLSLVGLISRKPYLSDLTVDGFRMKIVKDNQGRLNIEKILRAKSANGSEQTATKWKHRDWIFNLFERLKTELKSGPSSASKKDDVLRIRSISLRRGSLVLTDRRALPIVFPDIQIGASRLRVSKQGGARFYGIAAKGVFRAGKKGKFETQIWMRNGSIEVSAKLKNMDLALLKPLYRNASPVYFDRGYLTFASKTRMTNNELYSRNNIRIDEYQMRSSIAWSPESQVLVDALNRHQLFKVDFQIAGTPDRPRFVGFDDSLIRAIEKDFDSNTLGFIRKRTREEVIKMENDFRRI